MFNNYQSRPMKTNSNYNRPTTTTRGFNSPPIDFSVNDIVFDKKTFEKAPIDWSKNDINFTDSDTTTCNLSIPPPAIAQPLTVQRQPKTSGGGTSITLQEVAKNLENLLFLRQTMDETCGFLDQSGGFLEQSVTTEYMDGSSCYIDPTTGGYIDPVTGNYIDPATEAYVNQFDGSYVADPTSYEVPLYCDTVYYTQPTSSTSPPVLYSPNNPLYSEYTAAYSPNGSYMLHDGTCYSPNNTSYPMIQPGGHMSPGQLEQSYSFAPGSKIISRHNSVDSNYSSLPSIASSPNRDGNHETWIKTGALKTPIGPVKKDKTGSEDVFNADEELNSLVDLIISD